MSLPLTKNITVAIFPERDSSAASRFKSPIFLYQEMKLQFELHVSIEPAAASLQRFNCSGPPPRTRNFSGTPGTCTRCSFRKFRVLGVCVRVCVCVYVYVHVFICVCVWVRAKKRMCICVRETEREREREREKERESERERDGEREREGEREGERVCVLDCVRVHVSVCVCVHECTNARVCVLDHMCQCVGM